MYKTADRMGVCPIKSEEILRFVLNGLKERGVLDLIPEELYIQGAEKLGKRLPKYCFPDVYLDLPLTGGSFEGMAAVLDCYDRCRLEYISEGRYFKEADIPSKTKPEDRDTLLIICSDGTCREMETGSFAPVQERGLHAGLANLPVMFRKETLPNGYRVTFTTGPSHPREKITKRAYIEQILQILKDAGCSDEATGLLDKASYNCGVPYLHPQDGYGEWIVCLDIAAIRLTVQDERITDCHAVIGITDRCVFYSGHSFKPSKAYQWHITDDCDQRCKHCYLFAEDARRKCIYTPWDQLIHTLDEIEADATARQALAMPVISGGDPILHPKFWEFAEEIHRRGLYWFILGNPFHLNEAVCKRLHDLGCFKYQLSLDGLQDYHDHMRKPGSFQATLDAVKQLNDAGIRTQLMATVSRQNMADVLACMDVAVENNATFFTFARYCATSPEKAQEAYPSPKEYRDFLLAYYNKRRAYREKGCHTSFQLKEHLFTLLRYELGDFVIPEYAGDHPETIFDGCHLGMGCTILPNGDLMACRRMESVIGNVKEEHIFDVLSSEKCAIYTEVKNIRKCKDCELLNFCRGCRAVGFNIGGDLQGDDPMCWKQDQ